jgi:hypothetical protein
VIVSELNEDFKKKWEESAPLIKPTKRVSLKDAVNVGA